MAGPFLCVSYARGKIKGASFWETRAAAETAKALANNIAAMFTLPGGYAEVVDLEELLRIHKDKRTEEVEDLIRMAAL